MGKFDKLVKILGKSSPEIRKLAEEYAGKALTHAEPFTFSEDKAKKIADAYHELAHQPNSPEVKAAYDALIKETQAQYQKIKDSGLKISKITPEMTNPYPNGSKDLFKDINENKHMWYYPTEQGFGSGEKTLEHPLLNSTGEKLNGDDLLANDMFRIVHDYFGHAKEGNKFGPIGEEAAWREHAKMFSPEAQKALATETRGQNSWVNFGPNGEANRANPGATKYADQKAGILPDWAHSQSAQDLLNKITTPEQAVALKGTDREQYLKALDEVYGDQAARKTEMGVTSPTQYHGTPLLGKQSFNKFKVGEGKNSGELFGRGVYTTPDAETANVYADRLDQHSGVPSEESSGHVYPVNLLTNNHLDLDKPNPKFLKKLASTSWIPDSLKSEVANAKTPGEVWGTITNQMHPNQIADMIKSAGFDGIKVNDIYNTFSPNQIRSVNAAFDPRFKDSDLLMAGTAGALGAGALLGGDEASADPKFSTLKKIMSSKAAQEAFTAAEKLGTGLSKESSVITNPQVLEEINKLVPRGLPFEEAEKIKASLSDADKGRYQDLLNQVASQKERANAAGFGDQTWYHGNIVPPEQMDKFKPTAARGGYAGFVAEDPKTAQYFAEARKAQMAMLEPDARKYIHELRLRGTPQDPFIPLHNEKLITPDTTGLWNFSDSWQNVERERVKKILDDMGITNPRITENIGSPSYPKITKNVAVGNASDLRSVNASFDPDYTRSPYLTAGVAGAIGAGAALSSDDANAAGLTDIAKRLGVSLEEAAKIKESALSRLAYGPNEENIKAIKNIRDFKASPDSFPFIGNGSDYKALSTPDGQVLKVPYRATELRDAPQIAPSILEQFGLGPKTKHIQAGDRTFVTQDRVTPLAKHQAQEYDLISNDPEFQQLQSDEMNVIRQLNKTKEKLKQPGTTQEYDVIRKNINELEKQLKTTSQQLDNHRQSIRENLRKGTVLDADKLSSEYSQLSPEDKAVWEENGIRSPDDIRSDTVGAAESHVETDTNKKIGQYVKPFDLHSGNFGMDDKGNLSVFDTSRFRDANFENLTPELKQKILQNNILLPEQKTQLKNKMGMAGLGAATLGAAALSPDQSSAMTNYISKPASEEMQERVNAIPDFKNNKSILSKAINTYKALPEDVRYYPERGLEALGQPSGAMRGAVSSLQKGQSPGQVWDSTVGGFIDPEHAPSGADIADQSNISDEYPLTKASIATAADLLDPVADVLPLAAPSRFSKLTKLLPK